MSCLFLVTGGVESSASPPTQHKTIESVPAGPEPTLFFNGRQIWHIFLRSSPASRLCCSSNKCTILTNGSSLESGMNRLSSDTRFRAYDEIKTEMQSTKHEVPNFSGWLNKKLVDVEVKTEFHLNYNRFKMERWGIFFHVVQSKVENILFISLLFKLVPPLRSWLNK